MAILTCANSATNRRRRFYRKTVSLTQRFYARGDAFERRTGQVCYKRRGHFAEYAKLIARWRLIQRWNRDHAKGNMP